MRISVAVSVLTLTLALSVQVVSIERLRDALADVTVSSALAADAEQPETTRNTFLRSLGHL